MFRKKIPVGRIIPPFFLRKCRIWPFLNYLHDSNSIFWAQGIKSEGVFGRTVPTEGQTQTLGRHSDPTVDDDGRDEEEAPDNAMTDDEDDHTHKGKHAKVTQLRMPRATLIPPTANRRSSTANQWKTRLSTKNQDLDEHEESSHDLRGQSRRRAGTVGRPHNASNA